MRKLLTMLMVLLTVTSIQVKEVKAGAAGGAAATVINSRRRPSTMTINEFRQCIITRLREDFNNEPVKTYADENKIYSREYNAILEELKQHNITSLDEIDEVWLNSRITYAYSSYKEQFYESEIEECMPFVVIFLIGLIVVVIMLCKSDRF